MKWTRQRTLIAGLGLIAAVNAVVLAGVAYNRSGDPESTLHLTERELQIPTGWRGNEENSGLALSLRWRVLPSGAEDKLNLWNYYSTNGSPAWLDEAKMSALGFDTAKKTKDGTARSGFSDQLPRGVYLVLEQNGATYESAMDRARKNEGADKEGPKRLEEERDANSRLFVIDAGLDGAVLRARYSDRSRYAVVRGQIRPTWNAERGTNKLTGFVNDLSVASLNVPLEMKEVFDGAASTNDAASKSTVRYDSEVAFGQRLEPWILRASRRSP